jgi:glycosyltransferase involved in cell wall biosynthesis
MKTGRTRIVHVATRFLAAGSEHAIGDIVHALPTDRYEHILVVGREHDPTAIQTLCGDGVELVVAPSLIRRPHPIRDARAFMEIATILRRYRPAILHTIQSKSGIIGRLAGRATHVPVIVHTVAMANFGSGFNPILSRVFRTAEGAAARWTDQFFIFGSDLEDRFVHAGVGGADQYEILRSVVDPEPFRRASAEGGMVARSALGIPSQASVVLFAASLDRRKGTHELPAYFAALKGLVPEAHLLVAGDGPLGVHLAEELDRRGLQLDVTMLGFTDRLPEVMAAADCLVGLSRAEGLSTVFLFAAATGLPFVSYDVDGSAELIRMGADGAIVPLGATEQAAALTRSAIERGRGDSVELPEWSRAVVHAQYRAAFERLRSAASLP